eukprot:GHVQ01025765.1.p1 GENE.GHVQ01025765.1~~GHVQ01025765.1.p1  ORF type:complete len:173 (-),score=8.42 GHVQ01025765.1:445-963(-)
MLWTDKHSPRRLDQFICHQSIQKLLEEHVKSGKDGTIPHLLFYGPPGGGKKTRIMALIREIFGDKVDKISTDSYVLKDSNVEMAVTQSNHHVHSKLGVSEIVVNREGKFPFELSCGCWQQSVHLCVLRLSAMCKSGHEGQSCGSRYPKGASISPKCFDVFPKVCWLSRIYTQ